MKVQLKPHNFQELGPSKASPDRREVLGGISCETGNISVRAGIQKIRNRVEDKENNEGEMQSAMEIDELIDEWKHLSLKEEEKVAYLTFNLEESRRIEEQMETCLVGKLLSNRIISKSAIKNALVGAWKTRYDFDIETLYKNTYIFKFENKVEKEWINTRRQSFG